MYKKSLEKIKSEAKAKVISIRRIKSRLSEAVLNGKCKKPVFKASIPNALQNRFNKNSMCFDLACSII